MSFEVHCPACHRVETWRALPEPHRVQVRLPGGSRRPAEPPTVAAVHALTATLDTPGRTVFGPCEACGQPLLADTDAVLPRPWEVSLDRGTLRFDAEGFSGPAGRLDPGQALEFVHSQLPAVERVSAGTVAFTSLAAGFATFMTVFWVVALCFVLFFLFYGAATGQIFGLR